MSPPLLLDERIVVVQPALIRRLGHITDAAVLQQLHYWMPRATAENSGERWVYKTYEEWADELGLTPKQVRSSMNRLEEMGAVRSCQPEAYYRRKWYRIDYEHELFQPETPSAHMGDWKRHDGRLEAPDRANGSAQPGDTKSETTSSTTSSTSQERAPEVIDPDCDAERLAHLLADLIESNGSKRPNVTQRWVTTIDRMMRLDGRTPEQIENAIRWSQRDEFWQSNILSPDKLRRHYDRMRLQAGRNKTTPKGIESVRDYIATLTTDVDNRGRYNG